MLFIMRKYKKIFALFVLIIPTLASAYPKEILKEFEEYQKHISNPNTDFIDG